MIFKSKHMDMFAIEFCYICSWNHLINNTTIPLQESGFNFQVVFVITDELSIEFIESRNHKVAVPLLKTGIAWPSDKEIKFRNPPGNSLSQGEFHVHHFLYYLLIQYCKKYMHLLAGRAVVVPLLR